MPRGLSAGQITELAKRVKRPAFFIELQLSGGTVRYWNGLGTVTALGQSWPGVGDFGLVDGIAGNREAKASQLSIALVGLPTGLITPSLMASTRGVEYQGRPLKIYLAFTDPDTDQPLHDPTLVWTGVADAIAWRVSDTVSVTLTGEHFSSLLRRTNGLRMSPESHNARLGYPGTRDTFFDFQARTGGRPRTLL